MQHKFISLKAVLNYIPDSIRREESDAQLLSWAFQGFRRNIKNGNLLYDFKTCLIPIVNHKAKLPKGVLKLATVLYTAEKPKACDDEDDPTYLLDRFYNKADEDDIRYIVQQHLMLANLDHLSNYKMLSYQGQNPEMLLKSCGALYCKDCSTGFHITKSMSHIIIDECEGWLCVTYKAMVEINGELAIPDSVNLLTAMGLYAEAEHWRNRRGGKEANADNYYKDALLFSSTAFREFKNDNLFSSFNADRYNALLNRRFIIGDHPTISGKGRNTLLSR